VLGELVDLRTLIQLLALVLVLGTGVVGMLLLSRRPAPGAGYWGLALMFYVFSSMVFLTRYSFWASPVLAVIAMMASGMTVVLLWAGVRDWVGKRVWWQVILLYPLLLATLVGMVQLLWTENSLYLAVSPLMTAIILLLTVRETMADERLHLSGWMLGGCVVLQLIRVGLMLPMFDDLVAGALMWVFLAFAAQVVATGIVMYLALARRQQGDC
jgi:hypothetical protein